MGVLELLAWREWRGYPFKLFGLLDCDSAAAAMSFAQEMLADPDCIKDLWTIWFCSQHPTPEEVLGRGRVVLQSAAFFLRWEICQIECRNAALRRLSKMNVQTHRADLMDVSADFLLSSTRELLNTFQSPCAAGPGSRDVRRNSRAGLKAARRQGIKQKVSSQPKSALPSQCDPGLSARWRRWWRAA